MACESQETTLCIIRAEQDIKTHYRTSHCSIHGTNNKEDEIMGKNEKEIKLAAINVKTAQIFIEGDSDLVLNKMNARNTRVLTADDRKKIREVPNKWEDIITAINWRDGIPCKDTYAECDEDMLYRMLRDNAPCISAFGLKKSFGQAVVRNEIDKYATKFDNAVNVVAPKGLVPITFAEYAIDERLMSPKRGAPINVALSHFCGWKASFTINYTDHVFSIEQIVNIINLAGFGLGIGSGRTSGYGRYHVVDVK